MGARGHGQRGGSTCLSLKMLKSSFLLKMLSITSVDEVFMHHFEKMSSASGGYVPDPHRAAAIGPCWGTSVLLTPSLSTPGKTPAGARGH